MLTVIFGVAAGVAYVFHGEQVGKLSAQNIVITPDTFSGTRDIPLGSIVEITGTPDLLNAVTMEERNTGRGLSYFVPLKEYGTNFVVELRSSKLRSETQKFIGEVTGINQTDYDKRIKAVLNKPVELNDADRAELDPDTIDLLIKDTTVEFPNSALILFDGQVPEQGNVLTSIGFWTIIIGISLTTIFRRSVFKGVIF